jgi:hypothetical protein
MQTTKEAAAWSFFGEAIRRTGGRRRHEEDERTNERTNVKTEKRGKGARRK